MIGLARGLGLDVVAEGVEKQSQLDFLREQGCGACQGYLVCPPRPADEFENWLKQRSKSQAKKKPTARKKSPANRNPRTAKR